MADNTVMDEERLFGGEALAELLAVQSVDGDALAELLAESGLLNSDNAAQRVRATRNSRWPVGGGEAGYYLARYSRHLDRLQSTGTMAVRSEEVRQFVDALRRLEPSAFVGLKGVESTAVFLTLQPLRVIGCLGDIGAHITSAEFPEHVERAIAFLGHTAQRRGKALPPWTRVLVATSENGDPISDWRKGDEFQDRFAEVLQRVQRPWVNLHVGGVADGALLLVVEFFTTGGASVPSHLISVNVSGPRVVWLDQLPPANDE